MTANALPTDRDQCLNAGMDDFLTKPLRKELLSEAVETWSQKFPAPGSPPERFRPQSRPRQWAKASCKPPWLNWERTAGKRRSS
jgi:DNA-binding response OmpR family regulator